ncbi:MAG: zf-HC2 domain-containing protein, partial [Nannocystaceae bacterium]|nr:zf-HC2 domain-containing protein [Nannocystaceae bacterium]
MSLQDIRSECSGVAGLLQPYVDGELQSEEQEGVAEHLHACSACRTAVSEQAWVRTMLQAIDRERAPQAMRARILQGLDTIDQEAAAALASEAPPGFASQLWTRLRELGRGGLIMVPAGAAAVALFFVARQGEVATDTNEAMSRAPMLGSALVETTKRLRDPVSPDPLAESSAADTSAAATTEHKASGAAETEVAETEVAETEVAETEVAESIDAELLRLVRAMQPSVGFSVQLPGDVRRPRSGSPEIQLVSAAMDRDDPSADPSVRLRYEVRFEGRATGDHLVDRQLRAASFDAPGRPVSVGGLQYRLHRTGTGVPVVYFELANIIHAVMLEGEGAGLAIGVHPALPAGTAADYGPLLRAAEHLRAVSSPAPAQN